MSHIDACVRVPTDYRLMICTVPFHPISHPASCRGWCGGRYQIEVAGRIDHALVATKVEKKNRLHQTQSQKKKMFGIGNCFKARTQK